MHVAYPGAELDILDFEDCLSNRSAPEELEMEVDGMWCRPRRMRYGHVGGGNEQKTRGDVAAIGYFDLPVSVYLMLFGASKKQSNVDEGLRYVHTITYAPFIPQINRIGM